MVGYRVWDVMRLDWARANDYEMTICSKLTLGAPVGTAGTGAGAGAAAVAAAAAGGAAVAVYSIMRIMNSRKGRGWEKKGRAGRD
jgi:hypothetical protein